MQEPKVYNVEECPGCKVPKGWGHEIVFEFTLSSKVGKRSFKY